MRGAGLLLGAVALGCTPVEQPVLPASPAHAPVAPPVALEPATPPPSPRAIGVAAADRSTCVRWLGGSVTCAGRLVDGGPKKMARLHGAGVLELSDAVVCGLDGEHVLTCVNGDGEVLLEGVEKVDAASVEGERVCVLAQRSPRCWDVGKGEPIALEAAPEEATFVGVSSGGFVVIDAEKAIHTFGPDGKNKKNYLAAARSALAHNGRVCLDTGDVGPTAGCLNRSEPPRGFEARSHHSGGVCGISGDRFVHCYGSSLATGDLRTTWRGVMGLVDVREMSSGDDHACAIDGDGQVWCWGRREEGQLGLEAQHKDSATAAKVEVRPGNWVSLGYAGRLCSHEPGGTRHCAEPEGDGYAEAKNDWRGSSTGSLWDPRGLHEQLAGPDGRWQHLWVNNGSIGGAPARALEFSGGCSRFVGGRVGCVHEQDLADADVDPATDYTLSPFRGLGRAKAMRAWEGDVCILDRDDAVRCVIRPDPFGDPEAWPGWGQPTAKTVFDHATDFAMAAAGVCAVVDGAVQCSDGLRTAKVSSLGEGRLLAADGDAVCSAVSDTDARCLVNLRGALRGDPPRILDVAMGVQLVQLVTDGRWLCGRGTDGAVSCTGHPDTHRLGDIVSPKPVDVTEMWAQEVARE